MSTQVPFVVGALVGIGCHLSLFIHGEWEPSVPKLAYTHGGAEVILVLYLTQRFVTASWSYFFVANAGYLVGLFCSIGIYRFFFHPLRSFPGPNAAKLSVFWSAYKTLPDFQFHRAVEDLHRKHGDFVRIRPREISICNADAIADIHGSGSECQKGPFYDITLPSRSLKTTRDKSFHSQRRRVWAKGFTTTAMGEYEPRITEHCLNLVEQLSARANKPVDITSWISYLGFDVMGDLVFGKSFNMVGTAGDHFVVSLFNDLQPFTGLLQCIPWLFMLFLRLPGVSDKRTTWIDWCADQVRERRKAGRSRDDLFSYILGEEMEDHKAVDLDERDLIFDSELAIIGGSDTTSSTIAVIFYLLARHPEKLEILQREIDGLFQPGEQVSYNKLTKEAPFLQGCINEALRLYPAVPSGLQRVTPPGGLHIAGRWIPGETIVSTPNYSLHRDPRYFEHPEDFIPERWTSQPDMVRDKNAFTPFLIGSYSCVGKNLAFLEMRLVMYHVVKNLHFKSNSGAETKGMYRFDSNRGYRDMFIARVPAVDLIFSTRA